MNINFKKFDYLKNGNPKHQKAYATLENLQIFEILKDFTPILCGTIPIEIDIENSDLDIICYCPNLDTFKKYLKENFSSQKNFEIYIGEKRNEKAVICRFKYNNFEIEIFGQNKAIESQMAYRHMLIEAKILRENDEEFRKKIIELKKNGLKTEPAFAKLLNLKGDPYLALLDFE